MPHARIVASLAQSIRNHLDRHGGGVLYAGLGIVLGVPGDDRRMRAPELAFVAHATLAAAGGEAPRGFPRIVPDLVVEVVPPDDVHTDLQQKVQDYLAAGVRLVWLLHPSNRSATVFRAGGAARLLLDDDALDGGEVLPGLRLPLGEVLG
jgi:Uma2 family endonuclease